MVEEDSRASVMRAVLSIIIAGYCLRLFLVKWGLKLHVGVLVAYCTETYEQMGIVDRLATQLKK